MEGKKWDFSYRNPTLDNIKAVLTFLPFFENNQNQFFVIEAGGYSNFTDDVWKFVSTIHEEGFVFGFDYLTWFSKEGGIEYSKKPELLDSADILTIQKLLTTIVRFNRRDMGERGSTGYLKTMIEEGIILRILRRLEQLRLQKVQEHENDK